ncbi:vitellogenin-like isoform X2 [Nylanderia fulva]|nr:vitellogenin-like isoform X2 [Nylanderia fulva]
MIRMLVGQLSVGTTLDSGLGNDVTFDAIENFTQGECYTTFKIDKKLVGRSLFAKPGYALRPVFGLKDGKLMQIRKIRNLRMCAHKVPYFFGSAETFGEESDIISDVSLSDGHIIVTATEFISSTSNVITTSKVTEAVVTTLYENVRLRLESIQSANSEPPVVKEAESASIFIAANVTIDDQQSRRAMYGPECTYDVLVNMSLANIVHENDNFCSMIATELKCRPKGHDTLSCRFQNSRIKRPDPEDNRCSNAKNFVPMRHKFVDGEPFEIRFNSRGIENLVVHRSIPRWRLDMIKVIVSQLNIGFELQEHRNWFTIMENSTMGHCEVDVKISRGDFDSEEDDDSAEMSEDFEIEYLSNDKDSIVEDLRVEKTRHPKRCPRRIIYFFGDHEDYSRGNRELYMDMTSSKSLITISKDSFVSYTISEGLMKTANKSRIMRPHQNISLKLKQIDFAQSVMPEIQDPASTSLFAFSHLEVIPEDK